jgi:hypothetical protein
MSWPVYFVTSVSTSGEGAGSLCNHRAARPPIIVRNFWLANPRGRAPGTATCTQHMFAKAWQQSRTLPWQREVETFEVSIFCVSACPYWIICVDQQIPNDHLAIRTALITRYCVYAPHSFFRELERCFVGSADLVGSYAA